MARAAARYIDWVMRRARQSIAARRMPGKPSRLLTERPSAAKAGAGGERVLGPDLGIGVGEREDALALAHLRGRDEAGAAGGGDQHVGAREELGLALHRAPPSWARRSRAAGVGSKPSTGRCVGDAAACARSRCPPRRGRARRPGPRRGAGPRGAWRSRWRRARRRRCRAGRRGAPASRAPRPAAARPRSRPATRCPRAGSRRSPWRSAAPCRRSRPASRVSSTIGKAERPTNWWSSAALPSITGSDATGPTLPRPSTRVPLVTMATVLPRIV